jgi:hypothetical protein
MISQPVLSSAFDTGHSPSAFRLLDACVAQRQRVIPHSSSSARCILYLDVDSYACLDDVMVRWLTSARAVQALKVAQETMP